MPRKEPVKGDRRLLKRKAIDDREELPFRGKRSKKKARKAAERIKFTKTKVAKIDPPPRGKRHIYRDTHTPHLCLRVTPTAKTFYWEKTVRGAQKKVTIGRFPSINVEQARAKAADIAADYVKEKDVQAERKLKRDEGTFGALWEDYRENRPRRRPGTYSRALDKQWNHVLKVWETKRLSEVTYNTVFRMIQKMRKRAPVYANRVQRHGQAMFNFAKRSPNWRWRGDNPFEFDFVSEEGRARKTRLKAKDMPAFMAGLDACSELMRLLFLTSLYTGRRIGEVQATRWADLDYETGIWTIPITKIGEEQDAVLPNAIIELLAKRQRTASSPWVFPSNSKSGHVQEIKKAWEKVRKASGLHDLQARDLRRTLASWAQEVNVPIAVVQSQLGHSSITTTAKHYTSIDIDVQRKALDKTVSSMIEAAK